MRDYKQETENRVKYIQDKLKESNAKGIILGNSGGKDSALVLILCKLACENTIGVIMPCSSKRNYGEDCEDAIKLAKQFDIETRVVDLTEAKKALVEAIGKATEISALADSNINPRLRMTTLYTIAQSENLLVAGTGNRSEIYMGYFTKWGDGGYDFNPIGDLTATEVVEYLKYFNAPENIITKAPSAGLYEGQTDEQDMGVTYAAIDEYITRGTADERDKEIIDRYHSRSEHKRKLPSIYGRD
jgi:NAD+ synthase